MTSKEFLIFLYGIEVLNKLDTKLIQVKMMTHQTNKSVNKNNKYHDDVDVNRGEIDRQRYVCTRNIIKNKNKRITEQKLKRQITGNNK